MNYQSCTKDFYLKHPQAFGLKSGFTVYQGHFILDPMDNYKDVNNKWLGALRIAAWMNQNGVCVCGGKLHSAELHHALITKRDVQGSSKLTKLLINHSYNVILVHLNCHEYLTREECFIFLAETYGYEPVRDWYCRFPLKCKLNLE